MQVEIKKLDPRAIVPEFATDYSAGLDLVACIDEAVEVAPFKIAMIKTGLSINMMRVPKNIAAMIYPRSGKGTREGKVLANLTGVIDQDYHGELMVAIWNRNSERYIVITPGERFAQLVFIPIIRPAFTLVEEFSSTTDRGAGGFGSTG